MKSLFLCDCSIFLVLASAAPSFAAQTDGAFSDQTTSSLLSASYNSNMAGPLAGGGIGDFNRDGWQDIFYPSGGQGTDKLFINNRDGTFSEEAAVWGVALQHKSSGAAVGDYDGDGWPDIFVTSLGPTGSSQVGHHKLYHNNGDRSFNEVAVSAGVNQSSSTTPDGWGGAFGDYDLDGDLDLAVAGWLSTDGNRLFRNNGNGTFTDVTVTAGLTALTGIAGFTPRFVDTDGDRYPELVWIGDFGTSLFFVNNSDGTFVEVTASSGMGLDCSEMGMAVADWDEDGDFDIYVTTKYTNNLYLNQGASVFSNFAAQAGVNQAGWGWGAVAIDFNHDSLIDIVSTAKTKRNFAFVNTTTAGGSLSFSEVALSNGLGLELDGRGLSNFDFDNDGDQDLIVFTHSSVVRFFRNDLTGPDTNWLRVFLNRSEVADIAPDGIGSVVRLRMGTRTLTGRIDGGSNYLSNSEASAHFGLGNVLRVDEVRVEWSNGMVTILTNVAANQTLTITPSTGFQFCESGQNAAGLYGRLLSSGQPSLACNNFSLHASQLPPNQSAIFFCGFNAIQVPFGGGYRCVGGALTRLFPVVNTRSTGSVTLPLDFNSAPLRALLSPGTTAYFQLWHRDMGNISNTTNGLGVTFQ